MKKYIDAELQIVRLNNNDVIATSGGLNITSANADEGETYYYAPGRGFED